MREGMNNERNIGGGKKYEMEVFYLTHSSYLNMHSGLPDGFIENQKCTIWSFQIASDFEIFG
jgi:hypothetical protein